MLKFLIIFFVILWLLSFLMGNKRRLIRDTNHLLQLILWVALAFTISTSISGVQIIQQNSFVKFVATACIFAASYALSLWVASFWKKQSSAGKHGGVGKGNGAVKNLWRGKR